MVFSGSRPTSAGDGRSFGFGSWFIGLCVVAGILASCSGPSYANECKDYVPKDLGALQPVAEVSAAQQYTKDWEESLKGKQFGATKVCAGTLATTPNPSEPDIVYVAFEGDAKAIEGVSKEVEAHVRSAKEIDQSDTTAETNADRQVGKQAETIEDVDIDFYTISTPASTTVVAVGQPDSDIGLLVESPTGNSEAVSDMVKKMLKSGQT